MSLFNFSPEEMFTFFAVLVRFSVLFSVLPIIGDRFVPMPAKILFSLAVTIALYPALVNRGQIHPMDAAVWSSTTGGIISTIAIEAMFGLALGYTARLLFDALHIGANLGGNFMGFAMASTFDPHQESQTHVIAEIQLTIATLAFLALDGHHLMLRASLDSYRIVGIGQAGITAMFSQKLLGFTGQVIRFGVQLAAPVAVSLFAVNVAFGVFSKAMPQLNILVLSMAVSAFVGLLVLFFSVPEFQSVASNILGRMQEWMEEIMSAMVTH